MANNSIPDLFEKRMREQLGIHFLSFLESLQQTSPTSIRVNPSKLFQPTSSSKILWSDYGYYLDGRPLFTLDPCLHAGAYYVQEASSMFLEQAVRQSVDLTKPLLALDLCAAPGGKSTHLLSLLPKDSLLISNEVIRSRGSILSENIQKWGHTNTLVTNSDPEHFTKLEGLFDLIVVDAPCSGEGLFRKDENAWKEWSDDNVALCSQRQKRILNDIWPSLKTDGILIYCTCTYNEIENEENLVWLKNQKDAKFIAIKIQSDWGIEESKKENTIGYRFFPHKVKGEGFFLSIIQKTSNQSTLRMKGKDHLPLLSAKKKDLFKDWLRHPDELELIALQDLIIAFPKQWKQEIDFLSERLNIVTKGTAIATLKHEKLIPEHALALSFLLNRDHFITQELDLSQALKYLKKETFELSSSTKGFTLMTYRNLPLGWINQLGNRFNSLYPVNWRIRMNTD